MIALTAPKHYQYRHIATKQVVGTVLRFCDWDTARRFELVYKGG